MACIFIDGFDKYGIVGMSTNLNSTMISLLEQEWNIINNPGNNISIVPGLSSTGYALLFGNTNTSISKTLPASYSRLIGGIRISSANLAGGFGFYSDGSEQSYWNINSSGTISLNGPSGVLATSTVSMISNTSYYIEWDITFGASAIYSMWLNGVLIFTGTGNTGSSVNVFSNGPVGNGAMTIDDLYLFDNTGSTNNAVLNTNPRIETQFAISSHTSDFTPETAILGIAYSITSNTSAPGANEIFLTKVVNLVACNLVSVSCIPEATSGSANFKAVVYADSSGPNGAPLATGNQVTGTTSGNTLTSSFGSPLGLSANTTYWIGFITDTSVPLHEIDTTTPVTVGKAANTYTSGAPSSPSLTTGQNNWNIWGNLTAYTSKNWISQIQNPSQGVLSYVQDETPGNVDLYGFPNLTTSPINIYVMAVKCNSALSGSGTRTMSIIVSSNSVTSTGSNAGQTPSTTFEWMNSYFPIDPNTGSAWTSAGINAALSGPTVAS